MRIQPILNKIIQGNFYSARRGGTLMCVAAGVAYQHDKITYEEKIFVKTEIEQYIKINGTEDIHTLSTLLNYMGLPCTFEDRLKIYLNWEQRPGRHYDSKIKEFLRKMWRGIF